MSVRDTLRGEVMNGLENLGIRYCPTKNYEAFTRNGECDITGV